MLAADDSSDRSLGWLEPAIFAAALVSALNELVGMGAWPWALRIRERWDELSNETSLGWVSVRSRLAESEACEAGLGSPPVNRSRLFDRPTPAAPEVLLETDSVFGFN